MGSDRVAQEPHRSPKRADADLREFVAEGFLTVEAVRDRWVVVERDVRDYLSDLTQKTLGEPFSYVNLEGEAWTHPLWQTLIHVVNHQTYHRGQVTTLLRQLGAQPVQIDFLVAYDLGFRRGREKIR